MPAWVETLASQKLRKQWLAVALRKTMYYRTNWFELHSWSPQVATSRERPKSAPYPRLKIEKGGPFGLCETPAGCKK